MGCTSTFKISRPPRLLRSKMDTEGEVSCNTRRRLLLSVPPRSPPWSPCLRSAFSASGAHFTPNWLTRSRAFCGDFWTVPFHLSNRQITSTRIYQHVHPTSASTLLRHPVSLFRGHGWEGLGGKKRCVTGLVLRCAVLSTGGDYGNGNVKRQQRRVARNDSRATCYV